MSGVAPDPLDRIASRPVHKPASAWNATRSVSLTPEERDALVEVARAARAAVEHDPDETDGRQHLYDLAAALARLEGAA